MSKSPQIPSWCVVLDYIPVPPEINRGILVLDTYQNVSVNVTKVKQILHLLVSETFVMDNDENRRRS